MLRSNSSLRSLKTNLKIIVFYPTFANKKREKKNRDEGQFIVINGILNLFLGKMAFEVCLLLSKVVRPFANLDRLF